MIKKIPVKNVMPQLPKLQSGFSLVELMVAIALGVFLVLGVTNILFSGQQSFNATTRIARVQENGQLAKNMLIDDLKRARYMGPNIELQNLAGTTGPVAAVPTACNSGDNTWGRMVTQGLSGIDNGQINNTVYQCITTINPNNSGAYVQGDILTVRYASPWQATAFNAQALYIRSTFTNSWIFTGNNVNNAANDEQSSGIAGVNDTDPINSTHELITHSYYVGDSTRQCAGEPISSLFRVRLTSGIPRTEEIFPGIEDFQVQFSPDGINYFNANNVPDVDGDGSPWNDVVATQIWLLAKSECPEGGFTDNDGTRQMPTGVNLPAPGDGHRRQLYTSIISHRN